MRLGFAVLSNSIIIDKYTDQATLIGVITQLGAISFPVFMPKVFLTLFLNKDEGEQIDGKARLRITQDGLVLGESDIMLPAGINNTISTVIGFPLAVQRPGTIILSVVWPAQELEVQRLTMTEVKTAIPPSQVDASVAS